MSELNHHGNIVIGTIIGALDAATHVTPSHNLFGSAAVGSIAGAIDAGFAKDGRWGAHIGSGLLTTTATSVIVYYLTQGMMHSRIKHGYGHRHGHYAPAHAPSQYSQTDANWSNRVQPADKDKDCHCSLTR